MTWKLIGDYVFWVGCEHPVSHRIWTSNWQWDCLVCRHVEHVPEGAIGSVRKAA